MKRRTFIRNSLLAATAVAVVPSCLEALVRQDKIVWVSGGEYPLSGYLDLVNNSEWRPYPFV